MSSLYKDYMNKEITHTDSLLYLRKYREENDQEALSWLIKHNVRLVYKIASKYKYQNTHDLEMEDLVQAGLEGLLDGIERFDLSVETVFSTYVVHWVRRSILREIANTGLTVRLPLYVHTALSKITKHSMSLNVDNDVKFSKETLKELDISEEVYESIVIARSQWINNFSSLNKEIVLPGSMGKSEIQDLIFDGQQYMTEAIIHKPLLPRAEKELNMADKKEYIENLLLQLTERERNIIEKRFGLLTGESMTLEAIGVELKVTRERIRQIEKKALLRLNYLARHDNKEDWLDFK